MRPKHLFCWLSMACLLLTVCPSMVLAGWSDVRPRVQSFHSSWPTPTSIVFDHSVKICYYESDSENNSGVTWAAFELGRQFEDVGSMPQTWLVDMIPPPLSEPCNFNCIRIEIGLWVEGSSITEAFQRLGYSEFFDAPPEEGYYIYVEPRELQDLILLTASTPRGLNYAVSSLGQAITRGSTPRLEAGRVKDFPDFPKRLISYFEQLSGNSNYTHPGNLPTDEDLQADSLLGMARNILLQNKGNGIVHGGKPVEYSLEAQGTMETDAANFIHKLGSGQTERPWDTWRNLRMKWYESMGWLRKDDAANNESRYYRGIEVKSYCNIGPAADGRVPLIVNQNPAARLDNGDFEDPGTDGQIFDFWSNSTNPVPTQAGPVGSHYCKFSPVISGHKVWMYQKIILEPEGEAGAPSRQMVLSFQAKATMDNCTASVLLQLRRRNSNWGSDIFPDFPPATEWPDNSTRYLEADLEPIPKIILKPDLAQEWQTYSILFETYGTTFGALTISLENFGADGDISLDNVTITDADFYNVLDEPDTYPRTVLFYDDGEPHEVGGISNLLFAERCPYGTDSGNYSWFFSHASVTWPSPIGGHHTTYDSAEVRYWARTATGATQITVPAQGNALRSLLPPRREVRTDVATQEFKDVMHSHMDWFEEQCAENGITVDGYYCIENEFKTNGWMPAELTAINNGILLQENYGNFLHEMCGSLPNTDRQVIAWGDMFNTGHNGIRFSRTINPYKPLSEVPGQAGFERPEGIQSYEIPGLSVDDPMTFIDWGINADIDWCDKYFSNPSAGFERWRDTSLAFWQPIVSGATSNPNNYECLLGMAVFADAFEPNALWPDWEYYRKQVVHRALVSYRQRNREFNDRFTGGFLFEWFTDPAAGQNICYTNIYNRVPLLQWMWKNDPILITRPFDPPWIDATQDNVVMTARAYSPHVDSIDMDCSLDSVVFQYRFGLSGPWSKMHHDKTADSLYSFTLPLPEGGGVVEYRLWAFDECERYCSIPAYGTKWTDPDAGERSYLTFERRSKDPIDSAVTFYAPGILSQDYTLTNKGQVTIQPLPGFPYPTMQVTEDASITFKDTTYSLTEAQLSITGTDSTDFRFVLADSADHWGGIHAKRGQVVLKNVRFETGPGSLILDGGRADSVHRFQDTEFDAPITVTANSRVAGEFTAAGINVTGGTLELMAGTLIRFCDSSAVVISDSGAFICTGTDSLPILLTATTDSTTWAGVQTSVPSDSSFHLEHCEIRHATAGILANRGAARLDHCTLSGCKAGVLAINGARVRLANCEITGGQEGVVATTLSQVWLDTTTIQQNTGVGVLGLSRGTAYLDNSNILQNDGDGFAGGIGLYTGSMAFLNCTRVDGNVGPGITAYNGAVVLSSLATPNEKDVAWHGNSVIENGTVGDEGQLTLRGRVGLGFYNGHNQIYDSTGSGFLVSWTGQQTCNNWDNVFWGSLDYDSIHAHLPQGAEPWDIDDHWDPCPEFAENPDGPDAPLKNFLAGRNEETADDYSTAETIYDDVIVDPGNWNFAFAAVDRLLTMGIASGKPFEAIGSQLDSLAQIVNDPELATWLTDGVAWCRAEIDSVSQARELYYDLEANATTPLERVTAHMQRQMLSVRELKDSLSAVLADRVSGKLDSVRTILEELNVWTRYLIEDKVTLYAPCRVDSQILIQHGGELTIVPHPGAQRPKVHFTDHGSIYVTGFDAQYSRGKFIVQGQPDNHVVLAWDTVDVKGNVESEAGIVDLRHADFEGYGWSCTVHSGGYPQVSPTFKADSCVFRNFYEGLWCEATDTSSYMRACSLLTIGGQGPNSQSANGTALAVCSGSHLDVENCTILNSGGVGILNCGADDLQITGSTIAGSQSYGLLNSSGTNFHLDCSEIADNGGVLPEIWNGSGLIDMEDAHVRIADTAGTLLYAANPNFVDLAGGENSFELYSDSGKYLQNASGTGCWNISGNSWKPLAPEDEDFEKFLTPNNAANWQIDSSLALYLSCDQASSSSLSGAGTTLPSTVPLSPYRESSALQKNMGISRATGAVKHTGQSAWTKPADNTRNSRPGKPDTKGEFSGDHSPQRRVFTGEPEELHQWRSIRAQVDGINRADALRTLSTFIDQYPVSGFVAAALVEAAGLASPSGTEHTVSTFLDAKARCLPRTADAVLAKRLSYVSLAREGDPAGALSGLEEMMETVKSPKDSMQALADAMSVYFFNRQGDKLQPRYPAVRVKSRHELARRYIELARALSGSATELVRQPAPVPDKYCLYQNYPNPFNPVTEIRFDLPEQVRVELRIYNVLGQEVATLLDAIHPAGAYKVHWDSQSTSGISVASGMYVYRIKAGKFADAKKMMLIR